MALILCSVIQQQPCDRWQIGKMVRSRAFSTTPLLNQKESMMKLGAVVVECLYVHDIAEGCILFHDCWREWHALCREDLIRLRADDNLLSDNMDMDKWLVCDTVFELCFLLFYDLLLQQRVLVVYDHVFCVVRWELHRRGCCEAWQCFKLWMFVSYTCSQYENVTFELKRFWKIINKFVITCVLLFFLESALIEFFDSLIFFVCLRIK